MGSSKINSQASTALYRTIRSLKWFPIPAAVQLMFRQLLPATIHCNDPSRANLPAADRYIQLLHSTPVCQNALSVASWEISSCSTQSRQLIRVNIFLRFPAINDVLALGSSLVTGSPKNHSQASMILIAKIPFLICLHVPVMYLNPLDQTTNSMMDYYQHSTPCHLCFPPTSYHAQPFLLAPIRQNALPVALWGTSSRSIQSRQLFPAIRVVLVLNSSLTKWSPNNISQASTLMLATISSVNHIPIPVAVGETNRLIYQLTYLRCR